VTPALQDLHVGNCELFSQGRFERNSISGLVTHGHRAVSGWPVVIKSSIQGIVVLGPGVASANGTTSSVIRKMERQKVGRVVLDISTVGIRLVVKVVSIGLNSNIRIVETMNTGHSAIVMVKGSVLLHEIDKVFDLLQTSGGRSTSSRFFLAGAALTTERTAVMAAAMVRTFIFPV
jgi:hypothetical protein